MQTTTLKYDRFGPKTLLVCILRYSIGLIYYLFCLAFFALAIRFFLPGLSKFFLSFWPLFAGIAGVFIVIAVIAGLVRYVHYTLVLEDDILRYGSGFIEQANVGIPYKWIKGVNLHRSVADQVLGLTRIIITVLGEEAGLPLVVDTEIIFPPVDRLMAEKIQHCILERSQAQGAVS